MYGKGLLKGLSITFKHCFGKAITQQYPEEVPNLPANSHGFFELSLDKCISCGLCAKSCPNGVIELESERGEDKKRFLTKFSMDISYCLFCGLCVEACPADALHFLPKFELSCYSRKGTTYDFLESSREGNSSV